MTQRDRIIAYHVRGADGIVEDLRNSDQLLGLVEWLVSIGYSSEQVQDAIEWRVEHVRNALRLAFTA